MKYRGYQVMMEPRDDGTLSGRVVMSRDEITFTAPDLGRFRREAESAIDFYLSACEETGREPDSADAIGFLTVLPPDQAERLTQAASRQRVSPSQLISQILSKAV